MRGIFLTSSFGRMQSISIVGWWLHGYRFEIHTVENETNRTVPYDKKKQTELDLSQTVYTYI